MVRFKKSHWPQYSRLVQMASLQLILNIDGDELIGLILQTQ